MNRASKSVAALLLTGGAVGAYFGGSAIVRNVAFAAQEREVKTTAEQLETSKDLSSAFRNVGTVLEPSVVNITVKKTVKGGAGGVPFDNDMLRKFFKDPKNFKPDNQDNGDENPNEQSPADPGQGLEQQATGSGVILEVNGDKGYILTNNHVAGGASDIDVTLADGRRIENAKLLGADPKSDLAVVEIHADHLIAAKWGDSSKLRKGDWILAFGSPFGYIGSMTHGIVSALDRSNVGILGSQGYEDFIQVDAPINPGNSGGPLVNLTGEVVGINTAIASRSGAFSGIGFAIPSNEAKFVYGELKTTGKVTRGWLGVSIADVARDSKLAASFGYTGTDGVLVENTFPNTPANGKLQRGDIVTQFNGVPVKSVLQLRNNVASTSPNTEITLTVFRDGKDQDVKLKLGTQPEDLNVLASEHGPAAPGGEAGVTETRGMTLSNVNDELAQKFNLGDNHQGALVTSVKPHSPAAKAGLRPGDVIIDVGGTPVKSATDAAGVLGKHDAKKGVRLYVSTPEGPHFVFIEGAEQ